MQCPNCDSTLQMAERQGVEIDYCPQCRGVWLDRGELDKIIERSTTEFGRSSGDPTDYEGRGYGRPPHDASHHDHGKHGKYRKKKSLISELFDF
jgi:Zn-finger nucleic acid-binding protein